MWDLKGFPNHWQRDYSSGQQQCGNEFLDRLWKATYVVRATEKHGLKSEGTDNTVQRVVYSNLSMISRVFRILIFVISFFFYLTGSFYNLATY